jgi:hypothetical protein
MAIFIIGLLFFNTSLLKFFIYLKNDDKDKMNKSEIYTKQFHVQYSNHTRGVTSVSRGLLGVLEGTDDDDVIESSGDNIVFGRDGIDIFKIIYGSYITRIGDFNVTSEKCDVTEWDITINDIVVLEEGNTSIARFVDKRTNNTAEVYFDGVKHLTKDVFVFSKKESASEGSDTKFAMYSLAGIATLFLGAGVFYGGMLMYGRCNFCKKADMGSSTQIAVSVDVSSLEREVNVLQEFVRSEADLVRGGIYTQEQFDTLMSLAIKDIQEDQDVLENLQAQEMLL